MITFEIDRRDCNGRAGKIKTARGEAPTPNVLFIETERFPAPECAELILSDKEIKTGKPFFFNAGSAFSRKDAPASADIVIDNGENLPASADSQNAAIFNNLCIFRHARELFENPRSFAKAVAELKNSVSTQFPVYAQGLGEPANIALLAYCGVDLFDSSALIEQARAGYYLFADGKVHKSEMQEKPCSCPACAASKEHDFLFVLRHNYFAALAECRRVQSAILSGTLRELVEQRIRSRPEMVAILRHLDYRYYDWQESNFPVVRQRQMLASSKESIYRPEVERFRRRIAERYAKPESASVLLLLPCSAKKPYSLSKSHQAFREALFSCGNPGAVHEVILTSPLGAVPREIETFYPAQWYDVPVTGDWDEDEKKMISGALLSVLTKNKYDAIVCHIDSKMHFIDEVLESKSPRVVESVEHRIPNSGRTVWTVKGDNETSEESLSALSSALKEVLEGKEKVPYSRRASEDVRSFARFQFGTDKFLEDCRITGKLPFQKIMRGNVQLGMLLGERGMISLTKEGGQALLGAAGGAYCVEIEDFVPKANIFAVGVVGAGENIRIGDEVVVAHKKGIGIRDSGFGNREPG
ncbi:MAG: hypothetical protein CVT47_03430, partial [Thermoplasmata archaeon HGW-Thermoplasmata-2]